MQSYIGGEPGGIIVWGRRLNDVAPQTFSRKKKRIKSYFVSDSPVLMVQSYGTVGGSPVNAAASIQLDDVAVVGTGIVSSGSSSPVNVVANVQLDDVAVSAAAIIGLGIPINVMANIQLDDVMVSGAGAVTDDDRIYSIDITLESPDADPPLSSTGKHIVNSGSTARLLVTFKDQSGDPVEALTIAYRIDCLTTKDVIRDITVLPDPATNVEIVIKPAENEMLKVTSRTERHQVSIIGNYGTDDACTESIVLTIVNLNL